jgi:hypothetical protein
MSAANNLNRVRRHNIRSESDGCATFFSVSRLLLLDIMRKRMDNTNMYVFVFFV